MRLRVAPGDTTSADCIDQYAGICAVCGVLSRFIHAGGSPRESYRCEACQSSIRERGLAHTLVDLYGTGQASLRELCDHPGFASLAIYEPGSSGRHRKHMKQLPRYRTSTYRQNAALGETADGVHCQDLERLTYQSGSFDLVITSEILEHVRQPKLAFREIKRVLRLGGMHVFTIPLHYPMPPRTRARVDTTSDADRPLMPAKYHGDGKGGRSLVYTDFGADLLDELDRSDMPTSFRFVDATNVERRKTLVFTSRKRA